MKKTFTIALVLAAGVQASGLAQGPKTIEVHAKRFEFVPAEITITKGQPVTLDLVSDDVAHSLRVDTLNVNVKMPVGEKVETTITPEQAGDFKGRCGVYCGKGHGEMLFTIHVVDGK